MKRDGERTKSSTSRRFFIKATIRLFAGIGLFLAPLSTILQRAWAKTKRIILPKGTDMSSLVDHNPADLDVRNLEIIPLEDFETMGLDDHQVNLDQWRLEVVGRVKKPLRLTYAQLLELPSLEKKVLLICPGFFTIHGRWKGISVTDLLEMAEAATGITHVSFRGPAGRYAKINRFPIDEITADKIFLAYGVNGKVLPTEHGYPLRVVAEDRYGSEWVKYVHRIEAHGK
ncbi:hypothetical protein D1AOALGA4SA_4452 [Olavius algarvensis Delta 1 endosymbiont]|nr:hypothetical protein D1AOALGA4SA_4452 [Olavius algarvensis Delta 1 endosymbiont]